MNKDIFAIIDLGSNSFHMLIVKNVDNQIQILKKVKQKVRLASGLVDDVLTLDIMQKGWACLEKFAIELKTILPTNLKIVATATLRKAKNANEFIEHGEKILQNKINLISGRDEASIIYYGALNANEILDQVLVIDIGGASTELIIGKDKNIKAIESLNMGGVLWKEKFFKGFNLENKNFSDAINSAKAVINPYKFTYKQINWQSCISASGTMQIISKIAVAQNASKIDLNFLYELKRQALACKTFNNLTKIQGLELDASVVFCSGLSILIALFEELNINEIFLSKGALREGLIYSLFYDYKF